MAKNEAQRLKPEIIKDDNKRCSVITTLPDYKPSQTKYGKTQLTAASDELSDAQKAEAQVNAAAKTARARTMRAEWALHNLVLGSKRQVVAQYGEESDEVKSIGLKKKSEYKRPVRRKRTTSIDKAA